MAGIDIEPSDGAAIVPSGAMGICIAVLGVEPATSACLAAGGGVHELSAPRSATAPHRRSA